MAPQNYCCFFNWQKTSHSLCDSSRVQQSSIHCPTCPRSQRDPLLCPHPCDKPNIRWPLHGQEASDCGRESKQKERTRRMRESREKRRQTQEEEKGDETERQMENEWLAPFLSANFVSGILLILSISLCLLSFSFPIPPTSHGRTSPPGWAEKDRRTDEPHHTSFEQPGERQKVILQMPSHSMIPSQRASWNECWRRKQNYHNAEKRMGATTQQEKEKEEEMKGLKRILQLTEFTTTNIDSLYPYVSAALAPFCELECSIKPTPTQPTPESISKIWTECRQEDEESQKFLLSRCSLCKKCCTRP